jgi:transposase
MLGLRGAEQLEFFAGSLRDLIPDDHVLARVDRVLDLSWLRAEVVELYCPDNGRPGIDPETAIRLMLAGFLLGTVHDRKLMREAHVNLAIRWFAGFGLADRLPDHSSLTRIRQRWGEARFRRIFEKTVAACIAAKIAKGEIVHIDATLIRADVSWEALASRWVAKVGEANAQVDEVERRGKQSGKYKKVCLTDPDATMATSGRNRRLEPAYKQHTAVDDEAGVLLDVTVTTGQVNEGGMLDAQIDTIEATTGVTVRTVTADAGYAYAKVFGRLEERGIETIIPPKAEPIRSPVPMRRFRYDARHDILKCPRGKILKAGRAVKHGRFFTSRAKDCRRCDLRRLCLSGGRSNKAVVLGDDYPALLRARRRRDHWSERDYGLYQRHRWRAEGIHGEAKSWHGLARAIRRGLANMQIQAYLTAAAINLKRLAARIAALLCALSALVAATGGKQRPEKLLSKLLPPNRAIPLTDTERLGFFNNPTRQRCQVAPSTLATAAFSPSWASEVTSFTPRRPRRASARRNSTQNGSASLWPTVMPSTSRRPSVLTPTATMTATETMW